MRYVIGATDYSFIQIKFCTMWDGMGKLWNEIDKVSYDCFFEYATIINGYDEAKEILNEIQNRISEIDFSNVSILGQIIDEEKGFDKFSYAKKLKIFKLVPTLVED
jgi:hypothetical protein